MHYQVPQTIPERGAVVEAQLAFYTEGPPFESSHRLIFLMNAFTVKC